MPRMFRWFDVLVVADSRAEARAHIEHRYVDPPDTLHAVMMGRLSRDAAASGDYEGVDPAEYLHMVPPDEVIEIPEWELPGGLVGEGKAGIDGWGRAAAGVWAVHLGVGWMADRSDW